MVGNPLNWRYGDNVELLISIYINDDFMLLIKRVEQDPDLGVKIFIHKLMMIARLQIATERKVMMIIPPRHHMMVKI